jgi:hypothetical protein
VVKAVLSQGLQLNFLSGNWQNDQMANFETLQQLNQNSFKGKKFKSSMLV